MSDAPSIHDQFEEIMGFVMHKCEEESKLHMTHALTANEDAPACEMSTRPVKYAYWEDTASIAILGLIPGQPGTDINGNPSDQFNWCPYCHAHVWVSPSTPIGAKIECYWCRAEFARSI